MTSFNGSGNGIVLAAAAAVLALAGCGGSANDALPLIRAAISVKSISTGGECEVIPVRISPVVLHGEANKYANSRLTGIDITMTGPTDENGAPMCNGTGESLPLAPGEWEFSAPLRSGASTCKKEITADGDLNVILIDGIEGCSGAPPEPAMDDHMMSEGEMSGDMMDGDQMGEAPADAAAPADEAAPAG